MRIYDSIRGHFALLTNHRIETLSKSAPFDILRVVPSFDNQKDWYIEILPVNARKSDLVYICDILNVYTSMLTNSLDKPVKLKYVQDVVRKSEIHQSQSSYIMALLATFDDIKSTKGRDASITLVSHKKEYGPPIR